MWNAFNNSQYEFSLVFFCKVTVLCQKQTNKKLTQFTEFLDIWKIGKIWKIGEFRVYRTIPQPKFKFNDNVRYSTYDTTFGCPLDPMTDYPQLTNMICRTDVDPTDVRRPNGLVRRRRRRWLIQVESHWTTLGIAASHRSAMWEFFCGYFSTILCRLRNKI